jgi:hypothetical protein
MHMALEIHQRSIGRIARHATHIGYETEETNKVFLVVLNVSWN